MLAKLKRTTTLDYTHVAEPLDVDAIHRDITNCFVMMQEPDAIELWEHQRDWLAKPYRICCQCGHHGCTGDNYLFVEVGGDPVQPGSDTLFGIPITLRDTP